MPERIILTIQRPACRLLPAAPLLIADFCNN
nr:MAG TPA_asm: hypothetical protein [Caudoviricetes sp.]